MEKDAMQEFPDMRGRSYTQVILFEHFMHTIIVSESYFCLKYYSIRVQASKHFNSVGGAVFEMPGSLTNADEVALRNMHLSVIPQRFHFSTLHNHFHGFP